jgi:RNA methyltransferase, TrmH family
MLCVQTGVVVTSPVEVEPNRRAVFDGFHAWKHATRFGFAFDGVVATTSGEIDSLVEHLAPDLRAAVGTVERVDVDRFAALSNQLGLRAPHHTGVLGWGTRPTGDPAILSDTVRAASSRVPAVLVDGGRHLGNLGAVVRAAAAAESSAVFTWQTPDPWHPDVIRASAGLHAARDGAHRSWRTQWSALCTRCGR